MVYASLYVQNGAHFIATNEDKYDMVAGKKMPANGALVSSIATASDKKPFVVGKPNKFAIDYIC